MASTKCKLGSYIELRENTNADLSYGISDVRGVNNLKELMPTKADLNGRDLSKFQIVYPGEFVFNHRTSRNGSKFSIAYNDGAKPVICTEDYVVFRIKPECEKELSARWLYMFFNRPEFDRYVITNSWGSSTEFYNWEDVQAVELELPPYPVQQKYVDIYNAMFANQQSYEHGLGDLKLTCDAYIEKFKTSADHFSLSELIEEFDERNTNLICNAAFGVNKEKQFMPTVASGEDLSKYKVVRKGQFACNLMHVGRDITVPVAFNNSTDFLVVSPAYLTFQTKNNLILPEYLLMWLSRDEIGRYTWYLCDASIRGSMEKKRFFEIAIPVPPIKEQQTLVELFSALSMRKELLNKLRLQVKSLCPILIKGSIEEGMRTNEA